MNKQLLQRMALALEEEGEHEPDQNLLDLLRALAASDTEYFNMAPERRNALNTWFNEVKDMLLSELLEGNFGAQILLDTFFVLCFEVGFQLSTLEAPEAKMKEEG